MFNNPVLDVAIGLTFIYVLYSLLATTVKEFIATIFSYRGKMLERGIEQMLDGTNFKYFWWRRILGTYSKTLHKKRNLFACEITSHSLFVRASQDGSSEKPSYLAADTFSDILMDVLNPDKNGPVLLKNIEAEITRRANITGDRLNKDLQKILQIYLQQANGDVQRFKLLIENWYDGMMDRVGGWYKKQTNYILIFIGFCIAVIFNVSTIDIVVKLSKDKDVRDALVKNATEYVKNHMDSSTAPVGVATPKDSSNSFAAVKQKLDSMKALYDTNIADNNVTLGLGWDDFGYKRDSLNWVKAGSPAKDKPEHKSFFGKIGYVLWQSLTTPRYWLGFLLTALAISLGAPFWFDLLNKFVNLRVSGAKPAEANAGASKTANLNKKPDPTAKA